MTTSSLRRKPPRASTPQDGGKGAPRDGRRRQPLTLASWWWVIPALVLTLLIHYVAVGAGAGFAFTDWKGIGSFNWVGLDNFVKVFNDPIQRTAVVNTLFIALVFLIGTNVGGLLLALALNRGLKTRYVLRAVLFVPVVLSPLATAYIWQYIFQYDGPLNTVLKALNLPSDRVWLADQSTAIWAILFVMVWQSVGLVMVIYLAGLAGVPAEIEEAASIDGAGIWRRFWSVVLPSIRPSIVIATMLMLIQGLRVFDQVIALTNGGPFNATETLSTQVYKQTFGLGQYGYGAALSLTLTVIIVVFSAAQLFATRQRES
jgi:raffinose/stachyose/melibiose transport system permease protein